MLPTPSDFEDAYLVGCDAPKASGCNSGAEGWEIGRRPIADAVHRGGSFLDIGAWGIEPVLELGWRSATGRLSELAAIGLQRVD